MSLTLTTMYVLFLRLGDTVNHVEHVSDLYVIFTYIFVEMSFFDRSLDISTVCIFSRFILCMNKFVKTHVLLYNSVSDSTHTFNEGKMSQNECISSSQVMRIKTIKKNKKKTLFVPFLSAITGLILLYMYFETENNKGHAYK